MYTKSDSVYKTNGDGESSYPISKNVAVTFFILALSATSLSPNINNNISKKQNNYFKFASKSNNENNNILIKNNTTSEIFSLNNLKGGNMLKFELNEAQKYFDEKISNVKDEVHMIDKRTAALEIKIDNIQASINDLPSIIKTTMKEVEQDKKAKFSDRYLAPILVGVLSPIILYLLTIFGKNLLK